MKKTVVSMLALAAFLCAAHAERVILEEELAPLEARVEALEGPETTVLWWTTNLVSLGTYFVPTNFRTRNLEIRIDMADKIVATCIDQRWTPDHDVHIDIFSFGTPGTNIVAFNGGTYRQLIQQTGDGRLCSVDYDPASQQWRASYIANAYYNLSYAMPGDGGTMIAPPTGPSTVEEWEEMWLARKNGTPVLSMMSPLVAPGPAIESLDTLDLSQGIRFDEPDWEDTIPQAGFELSDGYPEPDR